MPFSTGGWQKAQHANQALPEGSAALPNGRGGETQHGTPSVTEGLHYPFDLSLRYSCQGMLTTFVALTLRSPCRRGQPGLPPHRPARRRQDPSGDLTRHRFRRERPQGLPRYPGRAHRLPRGRPNRRKPQPASEDPLPPGAVDRRRESATSRSPRAEPRSSSARWKLLSFLAA